MGVVIGGLFTWGSRVRTKEEGLETFEGPEVLAFAPIGEDSAASTTACARFCSLTGRVISTFLHGSLS
jgi:hypothetical protein